MAEEAVKDRRGILLSFSFVRIAEGSRGRMQGLKSIPASLALICGLILAGCGQAERTDYPMDEPERVGSTIVAR